LQDHWRNLALQLAAALASDDTSFTSAPGIRDAYSLLLARDTLYKHRLARWGGDQWSDVTRAGAQRELELYQERTAPWHELIEAWIARADSATEGSLAGFWYWLTDFYSRWQLDGVLEAILAADATSRIDPILGNALLPHSQTRLAVPLALPEDVIAPVYGRESNLESNSDDLAADALAPLSNVILLKAKELDYDPVRIFNFVQQHVAMRWYVGAMQGAERTLLLGSGNDVDSASLLVALLRAASIPARYETGIVRLPSASLKMLAGIDSPEAQMRFLQRHGRPLDVVTASGRISAFDVE